MDSIKLSNKACVLVRDITRVESTWLKRDFKINEVVYPYEGQTYNCISRNGRAFTEIEDTNTFFELPNDATRLLE